MSLVRLTPYDLVMIILLAMDRSTVREISRTNLLRKPCLLTKVSHASQTRLQGALPLTLIALRLELQRVNSAIYVSSLSLTCGVKLCLR